MAAAAGSQRLARLCAGAHRAGGGAFGARLLRPRLLPRHAYARCTCLRLCAGRTPLLQRPPLPCLLAQLALPCLALPLRSPEKAGPLLLRCR